MRQLCKTKKFTNPLSEQRSVSEGHNPEWTVPPGQGRVVRIGQFGSYPYKLQGCEMIRCESKTTRNERDMTHSLHQTVWSITKKRMTNEQPATKTKQKQTRQRTPCKDINQAGLGTIRHRATSYRLGNGGNRMLRKGECGFVYLRATTHRSTQRLSGVRY